MYFATPSRKGKSPALLARIALQARHWTIGITLT
jgi:hypothetical protein